MFEEIFYPILGAVVIAVGGSAITGLFAWVKNLSFIRKLNMENLIDELGEIAINYAEAVGRKLKYKGDKKLEEAREHFLKSLKSHGINYKKFDVDERLEAVFNRVKIFVEHKDETVVSGKKDKKK